MDYTKNSLLFKALADPTRLEIVDMVSGGELCACEILARFSITQPSLSHHMKVLCACGLVRGRKEGKWTYYSLDTETAQLAASALSEATSCTEGRVGRKAVCEEACC